MPPQATEFYTPVPPKVTPGAMNHQAPSDAIILFDGSNLLNFVSAKDGSSEAPRKKECWWFRREQETFNPNLPLGMRSTTRVR
jgi:hypothetical protein